MTNIPTRTRSTSSSSSPTRGKKGKRKEMHACGLGLGLGLGCVIFTHLGEEGPYVGVLIPVLRKSVQYAFDDLEDEVEFFVGD